MGAYGGQVGLQSRNDAAGASLEQRSVLGWHGRVSGCIPQRHRARQQQRKAAGGGKGRQNGQFFRIDPG